MKKSTAKADILEKFLLYLSESERTQREFETMDKNLADPDFRSDIETTSSALFQSLFMPSNFPGSSATEVGAMAEEPIIRKVIESFTTNPAQGWEKYELLNCVSYGLLSRKDNRHVGTSLDGALELLVGRGTLEEKKITVGLEIKTRSSPTKISAIQGKGCQKGELVTLSVEDNLFDGFHHFVDSTYVMQVLHHAAACDIRHILYVEAYLENGIFPIIQYAVLLQFSDDSINDYKIAVLDPLVSYLGEFWRDNSETAPPLLPASTSASESNVAVPHQDMILIFEALHEWVDKHEKPFPWTKWLKAACQVYWNFRMGSIDSLTRTADDSSLRGAREAAVVFIIHVLLNLAHGNAFRHYKWCRFENKYGPPSKWRQEFEKGGFDELIWKFHNLREDGEILTMDIFLRKLNDFLESDAGISAAANFQYHGIFERHAQPEWMIDRGNNTPVARPVNITLTKATRNCKNIYNQASFGQYGSYFTVRLDTSPQHGMNRLVSQKRCILCCEICNNVQDVNACLEFHINAKRNGRQGARTTTACVSCVVNATKTHGNKISQAQEEGLALCIVPSRFPHLKGLSCFDIWHQHKELPVPLCATSKVQEEYRRRTSQDRGPGRPKGSKKRSRGKSPRKSTADTNRLLGSPARRHKQNNNGGREDEVENEDNDHDGDDRM